MIKQALLMAAVLALLVTGCAGPKKYGARLYKVNLDSNPPGATLYLMERADWLELQGAETALALQSHALTENGGVAPIEGLVIPDYQHVLIGRLGDSSGRLEFKPTQHGETFVVTLNP